MITYPLALTALLAGSATAVSRSTKQEFIREMRKHNLDPKIMADAAKSSALKKSIMDEAIMVPAGRKLEEAANGYYNSQNNNQNSNQNDVQNYGTDDMYSFANDADWDNLWGFDASQYSLSYERCATVKHFDVEKAAEEDATSPFRTQHFAVLRLCPTQTCDRQSWYLEVDGDEVSAVEPEDDGEVYGAKGSGCSSNYATFLLDAGKYLQLMGEFEDTQMEMYCGYCEHYMEKIYQKWVSNGGSYRGRHLEFDEFKNHPDVERMLGGYDAEWYSCNVYANACKGGFQDDYADLLSCNQVEKNNGMVAYTQATCAEDGETITLGLFSDQYCSEDITSTTNIANWIGEEVDDEKMAHYYKKINSGLAELIETYGGTTSVDPESVCLPCAVAVSILNVLLFCGQLLQKQTLTRIPTLFLLTESSLVHSR